MGRDGTRGRYRAFREEFVEHMHANDGWPSHVVAADLLRRAKRPTKREYVSALRQGDHAPAHFARDFIEMILANADGRVTRERAVLLEYLAERGFSDVHSTDIRVVLSQVCTPPTREKPDGIERPLPEPLRNPITYLATLPVMTLYKRYIAAAGPGDAETAARWTYVRAAQDLEPEGQMLDVASCIRASEGLMGLPLGDCAGRFARLAEREPWQPVAKVIPRATAPLAPCASFPDLDESTDSPAIRGLAHVAIDTVAHESTSATGCWSVLFTRKGRTRLGVSVVIPITPAVYADVRSGTLSLLDLEPGHVQSPSDHLAFVALAENPECASRRLDPAKPMLMAIAAQYAALMRCGGEGRPSTYRMIAPEGTPKNRDRMLAGQFRALGTFDPRNHSRLWEREFDVDSGAGLEPIEEVILRRIGRDAPTAPP